MIINPNPPKRKRKRRCDSKYKEKFTIELRRGIRYKKGLSVMQLCHRWRISPDTFYDWRDSIPEFRDAYNLSKADYAAWLQENYNKIMLGEIKGNAGCAIFAMTNVEGLRWSNHVDVNNTTTEEVKKITIELLPSKVPELTQIDGEVIENEVIQTDNVIKLLDKIDGKRS